MTSHVHDHQPTNQDDPVAVNDTTNTAVDQVDAPMDAPVDGLVDGGRVIPFQRRDPSTEPAESAMGPGTAVEPKVFEGEIIEAEAPAREGGGLVRAARTVVTVRPSDRTVRGAKTTGRMVGRAVVPVWQGHRVWARRAMDAATHGVLREQIRSARAAGDQESLEMWLDRLERAKDARRRRIGELPRMLRSVLLAVLVTVTVLAGLLLVAGISVHLNSGGWTWGEWWAFVADAGNVLGAVVSVAIHIALYGALPAWLAAAWREGHQRAASPGWLTSDDGEAGDRDLVPDEGAILNALRNLNIPALDRKFREGWKPRWIQGATHDGRGWRVQLLLPEAVPVSKIVDAKDVLAHNLLRLPVEVWPTEPKDKPGVLDLWVADQGSLTKPVDPWPLLHEGTTNYFKGVPVGVNPQGKTVLGKLFQANWGVAGMMGSGKSTLIITALLGAMLDPLVEIDVYCMAENADYDPLKPRLRKLVKGDDPEVVKSALDGLRETMSDLSQRGRLLSAAGEPKLTRDLAERDPRMRPRIVVIDECQELFVSDVGADAAELVEKMVAKARKYGVTLLFATPVPSADSLPRKVAKVLSNKACFAIGDHQGNDAILGTGKHKAGISATTLRPLTEDADGNIDPGDIGTCMAVGFMAQDSLMRCYYPRRGNGVDEVTPVVQRALELRDGVTGAEPIAIEPAEEADPLADIAAVLGNQTRMRTQAVLHGLIERDRASYGDWTLQRLSAFLTQHGAAPYKSHGEMSVKTTLVRDAIADRDEQRDADSTEEDTGE